MTNKKIIYNIVIPLMAFFIISCISIYSASIMLTDNMKSLLSKQVLWYLIGLGIVILMIYKLNINKLIDYTYIFYIIGNILLLFLLLFGKEINGSKCWFQIPGIGSFQPSEFMKLVLILVNASLFKKHSLKYPRHTIKSDIILFAQVILITLLPSILTFLEPDTGMVIIYFLISMAMLFSYGINKNILIAIISIILILISLFIYYYFYHQDMFINMFGTSFFYRVDRILDWQNKSGMQLTNAVAAVKAAGLFGFGLGKTPIYFPEPQTDFIFSVYASNFGLIGCLILVSLIVYFDISLIYMSIHEKNKVYKFIIIGYVTMIIYQQLQNIAMNIGLVPITGITLPFISYGGSSLLSYIIGIGIIMCFEKNHT